MDDLHLLQGAWAQISFEIDGSSSPRDAYDAPGIILLIESNRFLVRSKKEPTPMLEGTFRLDPTTTPKTVDWMDSMGTDAGKTLPAIYRLEDDRFTFVAADADMPRPTEFKTKLGLTMRTFMRSGFRPNGAN